LKVPIGIDKKSGDMVLINDITKDKRGLACNCICPHCKSDLVARFCDDNKINHFSHHESKSSRSCKESSLHLYGKYVLSKLNTFNLKAEYIGGEQFEDMLGNQHEVKPLVIFGDKNIVFTDVTTEKKIGGIKGDVFVKAAYENETIEINFEIKVRNKVDDNKKQKIRKLNLNTIEIDLSHLLKMAYVDFDLVKKEILNLGNHLKIHLDSNFISNLKEDYLKRVLTPEKINKNIEGWVVGFEKILKKNGLELPEYEFNLSRIPSKFEEQLKDKYPLIFNPIKTAKVISFKHIFLENFEVALQFNNSKKSLLVVMETGSDSLFFDPPDESYLIISNPFIDHCLDADFSWGRNNKAEGNENECNGEIARLIKNDKKQNSEAYIKYQKLCEGAISSGMINECSNYNELKENSVIQYELIITTWDSCELLESILIDGLDKHSIFGCEPRVWQINVIYLLLNTDQTLIDIRNIDNELESVGIQLVTPFKEYMDCHKLLPKNLQKSVFDVPSTIFRKYFEELSNKGLLKPYDENRYMIQ
jgi:hypothetical protein